MMPWREIGPYLRELWHRPAGPMNWKNPIRVFAVVGWLVVQGFVLLGWAGFRVFQGFLLLAWAGFRVGQFVAGLPPLLLFFFAAVGWAGWSFVHRPFPPLDEHPILVLVEYHTPNFFDALVVWYYVTPFAVVMLTGFISVTIWRVWLEGRRSDFASFSKLPPWPLDPKQKAPAIVIGEVHHPVEAREVFNPSWLTIPERGLYTGVAIFGAVGSGKTSACMNPFSPRPRSPRSWTSPAPPSTTSSRPARSLRADPKARTALMLYFNTNVGATLGSAPASYFPAQNYDFGGGEKRLKINRRREGAEDQDRRAGTAEALSGCRWRRGDVRC